VTHDAQPIVVAYDGSGEARAALAAAAGLFPGRRLVVVTVWEPGLAYTMQPTSTTEIQSLPMPSFEEAATIDRLQRRHAAETAAEGAQLARALGADGEPLPVADGSDVARTLLDIAQARDAAALAVGSRGLGAVRSRLEGSTSRRVLHDTTRPVLVVHPPRP